MNTTATTPNDRRRTVLIGAAAVTVGLIGSAALIWHSSYSAFSAQASTPQNNWATGTVQLSSDNAAKAAFDATNLTPGASGEKCITVTSTGSLASKVKLYATDVQDAAGLGEHIHLTVTQGSLASPQANGACDGFSADSTGQLFDGTLTGSTTGLPHAGYASGLTTWSPAGDSSSTKTFKITYAVDSDLANTFQNTSAKATFVWEAQNS